MNITRKRREVVTTVKAPVMEGTEAPKLVEEAKGNFVSESQRTMFETVMANLNPFGTDANGKVLIASGSIPLSLCYVDERYQGMRKHKKIKDLESKWDIRKLGPIALVPHPEECRFAIVDGQARSIIAPKKGMKNLQAIVYMDAPKDSEERLKFEAEYFIGQDTEAESVKPIEKHLARVIIGDTTAITFERLLKKYGVDIVKTKGQRAESVLGSYVDGYEIVKHQGEECLDFIFGIIENAGWNDEVNGYATCITRALKDMWVAHEEYRGAIHGFLSKELRQMDPYLFSAKGRAAYPQRDHRTACSLMLEDMVCEELDIEKCIYVDGKGKKCMVIK